MTIKLKVWDWVALVLSLSATAGFTSYFFLQSAGPAQVQVETRDGLFLYPINTERELAFEGPAGKTHLHVAGGRAWIHESDCKNGLCISMGKISRSGEWIACLPNRVFVRITGGTKEGVDAQTF